MGITALVLWILTAGGGFYLLAKWVSGGGHRRPSDTKFPPALIFGHFLLAAAGLVLWIIYVATGMGGIGWLAFIVLAAVALMGFAMLALWIPSYRNIRAPVGTGDPQQAQATGTGPPERSFPVAVVAAHGVLAVATAVLVLLTMLGIGAS
jgi:manganese efflux pump family protein